MATRSLRTDKALERAGLLPTVVGPLPTVRLGNLPVVVAPIAGLPALPDTLLNTEGAPPPDRGVSLDWPPQNDG